MKHTAKLLLWAYIFTGLTCLFTRFGPVRAAGTLDRQTALDVLTDQGTVAMTMADYLPYAVAAEMPAGFNMEALKAQAVAARTYALAARRHENADVCTLGCCISFTDEPSLRTLWGADYDANWRRILQAVSATDGEYLAYGGQAIQAAFHASSLGCTESSAAVWSPLPYLVSVDTPEDPESVPGLVTRLSVAPADFAAALGLAPKEPPERWLELIQRDEAGRVCRADVCGGSFTGLQLRQLFGLRSTDFTLVWDGGAFTFTVAGYGHGVGMSQYGARSYADQGWSYRDILAHYYPGTELCRRESALTV